MLALTNCEINLSITSSEDWVIFSSSRKTKSAKRDIKLYQLYQDNTKLIKQAKPCFERATNWNKY